MHETLLLFRMEGPFIYDSYVTGKNFLGRKKECEKLAKCLADGQNVALWDSPYSGKMSLVQQTLANLRLAGQQFLAVNFDMSGVRTVKAFKEGLWDVFCTLRSTQEEKVPANLYSLIKTPYHIASEKGRQVVVMLSEFQNIAFAGDAQEVLDTFEQVMDELNSAERKSRCSYIFCGNRVNAMKELFLKRGFLKGRYKHISLEPIPSKEIINYINKGFQISGKVIEKDYILERVLLFEGNMWHINHFFSIIDSYTKGYINRNVDREAMASIISIYEPWFNAIVADLTDFQLSLLKAIIDGKLKLSSAEVIADYGLHSSANVRRVKDALCKKEVISFTEAGEAYIIDPLLKYWLKKCFFS